VKPACGGDETLPGIPAIRLRMDAGGGGRARRWAVEPGCRPSFRPKARRAPKSPAADTAARVRHDSGVTRTYDDFLDRPVAQARDVPLDSHLHTELSPDSAVPLELYCAQAAERGVREIAITDHLDFMPGRARLRLRRIRAARARGPRRRGEVGRQGHDPVRRRADLREPVRGPDPRASADPLVRLLDRLRPRHVRRPVRAGQDRFVRRGQDHRRSQWRRTSRRSPPRSGAACSTPSATWTSASAWMLPWFLPPTTPPRPSCTSRYLSHWSKAAWPWR